MVKTLRTCFCDLQCPELSISEWGPVLAPGRGEDRAPSPALLEPRSQRAWGVWEVKQDVLRNPLV